MACILIVEDAPDVRAFMDILLSESGYETMCAGNGEEALAKMRTRRPCVVLLDLNMPVMDGWEFRRRQLEDSRLADVPVVCVTGVSDPSAASRKLGVQCLTKPVAFPAVLSAVQTACGYPTVGEVP